MRTPNIDLGICNMTQPQVPQLCVADARCQSSQHRCLVSRLWGHVCIWHPSLTDPATGPQKVQPDSELHSAADSSILAKADLAPSRSTKESGRPSRLGVSQRSIPSPHPSDCRLSPIFSMRGNLYFKSIEGCNEVWYSQCTFYGSVNKVWFCQLML